MSNQRVLKARAKRFLELEMREDSIDGFPYVYVDRRDSRQGSLEIDKNIVRRGYG